MSHQHLEIIGGPDKPALQWAVAYPEREHVTFELAEGPVNARILEMNERAGGLTFDLDGILTSGRMSGCPFKGSFDFGSRKGLIVIDAPDPR